ncbi:DNA replication/repair protein RecF [Ferroacidibacillus organovorans]|uniref:DNA replication and repair protein RecF n=1 Tax=Ferroacidibacillus organovorans TaxID=1765683 RepID=A0A162TGT1_9BACL|nr:DNA replication/repair protein RecF [Ferroacidibacillus organovorans]KYP80789.1 hypothetical protein AYJ22_09935 [Ferroacidibacillus organovorans]OAG93571.1 hypothetical protein AYW79_10090 [Ferroacidibacillus organovorans]OPG16824.1 DNA replication and repair protein RecF [Ferroacidibacillus organovorans]
MIIKQLDLMNIRKYEFAQALFSPGLNIIQGDNASGKTTLLEAISLFSIGHSPRTGSDRELIRFGTPEAKLRIQIEEDIQKELSVRIGQKGKQIWINRAPKKSLSELLGQLRTVMFTPDDLQIVKGGPDQRRRFLNATMAQYQPTFLRSLAMYQTMLQKRNAMLKMKQDALLRVWDEQMVDAATEMIVFRIETFKKLFAIAELIYKEISDRSETFHITYKGCSKKTSKQEIKEDLLMMWETHRQQDFMRGFTTVGPHREDIILMIDDQPAIAYASQGQQRTIALSLKLAFIELIEEATGHVPVLLLDDVFSELDAKRQHRLVDLVNRTQTIVTVASIERIQTLHAQANTKFFLTAHGELSEVTV